MDGKSMSLGLKEWVHQIEFQPRVDCNALTFVLELPAMLMLADEAGVRKSGRDTEH